jgi:transcriptional regulator with PAS, ATPase and Fis domain
MTTSELKERIRVLKMNGVSGTPIKVLEDQLLEKSMNAGKQNGSLRLSTDQWLQRFITADPQMIKMKERVRKLAPYNDSILILGPTGTGKELIAQALHGDRTGQFISINCAGLPVNLVEHELFGSVKGAFTGSDRDKQGLMAAANDGTLFLDEVGELVPEIQAKFLRAIETMHIRRVGSNLNEEISCRFIAATQQPLETFIKERHFREDLYWRLAKFTLRITSLQERPGDIPLIAEHYYKKPFLWLDKINLSGNVRGIQTAVRTVQILGEDEL